MLMLQDNGVGSPCGIVPLRLLPSRYMSLSVVRAPSCVGRLPLRLLSLRYSNVSSVRAKSCVGRLPLRLL